MWSHELSCTLKLQSFDKKDLFKLKLCLTEFLLFIPRHMIVAGYHGFTLVVRVSVRLSVRSSVCLPYVRPSVLTPGTLGG